MNPASTPGGPSWQHEPAAPTTTERVVSSPFFRWIRGLDITRAPDRWVGGVAGGIAGRTGLDLALVRGLIVILSVFGGIGVLLYGLAWALLPEPDGRIHVEQAGRGSWTSGLTGAAALVVIGLWRPNLPLLGDGGSGGLLWALFWIGAVVLFVYWIVNRSSGGRGLPGTSGGGQDPRGPQSFGDQPAAGSAQPFGPVPYSPDPSSAEGPPGNDAEPEAEHPNVNRTVPLPYQPDLNTRSITGTYNPPYSSDQALWSGSTPYSAFPSAPAAYPASDAAAHRQSPARHRPLRPSGSATALLIGGAIVTASALLVVDYLGILDLANPAVVAFAAAAIVLALGVLALGARGRTSGLVGLTGALALVAALVASFTVVGGTWIVVQDSRTTPISLRAAAGGYSVMAAQSTIDLADLPTPTRDVVVPVNVLVSDVTVIVPDDLPVEVRTRMALGNADARGTASGLDTPSPEFQSSGGVLQLSNGDLNPDTTGPALVLDVRGALSDVTIVTAAGSDSSFPPDASTSTPTGDTP
ncbi:phage shock protein PspC (stress-responsive transcriptional regulator) [Arthrobacter sp. PL16]|uniref:PspC domain-containing protein n=1 Tax=Arthrobacter sp. PL16 TaxID=3071720 RepID=UPI002DFFE2FB|nr:phage shock protein PspC (stress-responsive transcriptional regulator) [Arthrobacter sp. PL16]